MSRGNQLDVDRVPVLDGWRCIAITLVSCSCLLRRLLCSDATIASRSPAESWACASLLRVPHQWPSKTVAPEYSPNPVLLNQEVGCNINQALARLDLGPRLTARPPRRAACVFGEKSRASVTGRC
jgi:hypothetical protein